MDKLKKIGLNIGRGFLLFFGVIYLALMLYGQFEEGVSLAELSILELIFWGLMIAISWRHYLLCKAVNMNIKSALYSPLRNIGWLLLAELLLMIGLALLFKNKWTLHNYSNENLYQFFDMAILLICICFAAPKQQVVKP